MDGLRFDEIAIALGTRRRAVLGALLAGAAGAVLGPEPAGAGPATCKAPGQVCTKRTDCCATPCKKKRGKKQGRCKACGGGRAYCNGVCCAAGQDCVGGVCCPACADGQRCVGGQCVCDPTSCPNGCCDGGGACAESGGTCGTGGVACATTDGAACGAGGGDDFCCEDGVCPAPSGCLPGGAPCPPNTTIHECAGLCCSQGAECTGGSCTCLAGIAGRCESDQDCLAEFGSACHCGECCAAAGGRGLCDIGAADVCCSGACNGNVCA